MRIIGGELKKRRLKTPDGKTTRPMADRVRESLFNILAHHDWGRNVGNPLTGAKVLDAFCGTGALAFEALSRGASYAVLFDKDRKAFLTAKENAVSLGLQESCSIIHTDALFPPKPEFCCNIVFLAPPYGRGLIVPSLIALDKAGWIDSRALIITDSDKREELEFPERYKLILNRDYGNTRIAFLVKNNTAV